MTPAGYSLLLLTALVGCLAAVVMFAFLRFAAAARDTRRTWGDGTETGVLAAALQEAVVKLRAQERATAARAEASERLSGEIISSLTSGLLVVGLTGVIRILNPAGRRILAVPESLTSEEYQRTERERPLFEVIDECLRRRTAIVRRAVVLREDLESGHGVTHLGVGVSPLSDEEGQLHGAICLFTDLTAVDLEESCAEGQPGDGGSDGGIAPDSGKDWRRFRATASCSADGAPEAYRP